MKKIVALMAMAAIAQGMLGGLAERSGVYPTHTSEKRVAHYGGRLTIEMLVIDRFEGDFAVVDIGERLVDIPRSELPANAKEGDILVLSVDEGGTAARKKSVDDRVNGLFK